MDRSSFSAQVVTSGPLDGVDQHVGWVAYESGDGPHLLLMRGTGDDDYCVVSGDAATYATHYGGVVKVEVQASGTKVFFDADAAAALDLPAASVTIGHWPGAVDAVQLRRQVDDVLGG